MIRARMLPTPRGLAAILDKPDENECELFTIEVARIPALIEVLEAARKSKERAYVVHDDGCTFVDDRDCKPSREEPRA